MWGILDPAFLNTTAGRFIPTRVGNTFSLTDGIQCVPVHPHACGEYIPEEDQEEAKAGSSPRVWGILYSTAITAYPFSVHPHACGEYFVFEIWCAFLLRFIPTRVGNTLIFPLLPIPSAVHPHACGEYRALFFSSSFCDGSSPRVWGILTIEDQEQIFARFIPTRVGNTPTNTKKRSWRTVHPHACGEYTKAVRVRLSYAGSSPRVWGILFRRRSVPLPSRFIPTRVGNTTWCLVAHHTQTGSSPRVWGIHASPRPNIFHDRFIPTRVGNTSI